MRLVQPPATDKVEGDTGNSMCVSLAHQRLGKQKHSTSPTQAPSVQPKSSKVDRSPPSVKRQLACSPAVLVQTSLKTGLVARCASMITRSTPVAAFLAANVSASDATPFFSCSLLLFWPPLDSQAFSLVAFT
jgi:hypothetical protein